MVANWKRQSWWTRGSNVKIFPVKFWKRSPNLVVIILWMVVLSMAVITVVIALLITTSSFFGCLHSHTSSQSSFLAAKAWRNEWFSTAEQGERRPWVRGCGCLTVICARSVTALNHSATNWTFWDTEQVVSAARWFRFTTFSRSKVFLYPLWV